MAVDWSRQISFSGLRKRSAPAKTGYPEKTYMNLVVSTKKERDLSQTVLRAVLVVVVVALIIKFGIFDFYARVGDKQAEFAAQQRSLNTLNAQLVDYDQVLAEYQGYASVSVAEGGLAVDAMEALGLVDDIVAPSARIMSIALAGDTMTLNVTDVTLDGVGQLVSRLYEQGMVKDVSVATAATQQTASEDVTAALTITLAPLEDKEAI